MAVAGAAGPRTPAGAACRARCLRACARPAPLRACRPAAAARARGARLARASGDNGSATHTPDADSPAADAAAAAAADAVRAAQSQEASSSGRIEDDVFAAFEAEEAYEHLRSPSLQAPSFRERPLAALLQSLGIDRSGKKRRSWLYAQRYVLPVCLYEPRMRAMTDEQLRAMTPQLRARHAQGATLDELLPEAFALVREVSRRVLGLRHYDVQIIGGAVLHEGNIAEMGTGEGKTLVATLAAYLNALPQIGSVLIVTVNEYLAKRDAVLMGRLYRALGLTCGCVLSSMSTEERVSNAGYGADVTYSTALELGFDYLRDGSAMQPSDLRLLRPFWFAIVDEADSILLDEARNPMLLARPMKRSISRFEEANRVAQELREGYHYSVNWRERNVMLTDEGVRWAEAELKVEDLFAGSDSWASRVTDAVAAKELYQRDTHYLVRDSEVIIVDVDTGRVRKESRWAENMHQAIEAKEGLEVRDEQLTIASITYQSFFKLFPKLAGMSGTAHTEVTEFFQTYRVDVVAVPPNKPVQRIDRPFTIVKTEDEKWDYIALVVAHYHAHGVPAMVGTSSVYLSDLLSEKLTRMVWRDRDGNTQLGIPHNLLNARPENVALEAAIVAQAGRPAAVTIATNMAGRGTDIVLGGNPLGLARGVLLERLFPAFGLELPRALSNPGAPIALTPAVGIALDRAAQAARFRVEKDGAEKFTPDAVNELLDAALERADTKQLADSGSVLEDALAFAAHWVLCGCRAQCEADGAFVRAVGGLQVIGTSFNDSRRVDAQLRGRAGRQGDPGGSDFVISTEDEVFRAFREMPLVMSALLMLSELETNTLVNMVMMPVIRNVQEVFDDQMRVQRAQTFKYDHVLHVHREVVLGLRRKVLLDTRAQRRARFFSFFEEMLDEALSTMHFDEITPPSKWAIGRLLRLCRQVTASFAVVDDKTCPLINFLPGVMAEELATALEYGEDLPLGHALPPKEGHPLTLTVALASETYIPVVDKSLPPSCYDDAKKATAAAVAVMNLNIERRLASVPTPRLATWAPVRERLRAFLIEYLHLVYNDREERVRHKGMPPELFDKENMQAALRSIDDEWGEHLAKMTLIRYSSQLSSWAVQDPLVEYRVQGNTELTELMQRIKRLCITSMFYIFNPMKWDPGTAPSGDDDGARQHQEWLDLAIKVVPDYEPERVFTVCYSWRVFFAFMTCLTVFAAVYPKALRAAQTDAAPPADGAAGDGNGGGAAAAAVPGGEDIDTPAVLRDEARG